MDNGLVLKLVVVVESLLFSLNPYCSGQWSRTDYEFMVIEVEAVLILIVVDNGLVLDAVEATILDLESLNPYCSGQWSRTFVKKMISMLLKLS